MPIPTYRAFRRVDDDTNVPPNSNGDKRIKSWLWDDNLAMLNTLLERISQAAFEQGGVITPGTVAQSGNTVQVTGRMGITHDGLTAVALPTASATSFDCSTLADGHYLVVVTPGERTVAEAFSDPSTSETITDQMVDDLGQLGAISGGASYPATPDNGVACAQVQVASGAITAFTQLDEDPLLRTVGVFLEASATLDFPSIAAGAEAELTASVSGAVAGAPVFVGAPAAIEAGLSWGAYVSAAGTVTIRVRNDTAAAIDPASAIWTVRVAR